MKKLKMKKLNKEKVVNFAKGVGCGVIVTAVGLYLYKDKFIEHPKDIDLAGFIDGKTVCLEEIARSKAGKFWKPTRLHFSSDLSREIADNLVELANELDAVTTTDISAA